MESDSNHNNHVQTAIRWRPFVTQRETSVEKVNNQVSFTNHIKSNWNGTQISLQFITFIRSQIVSIGQQLQPFVFDHVFDGSVADECSQAQVYQVLVKPLIDRAFEGYDCTFLAIGQSGSGKTYTVGFDQNVSNIHLKMFVFSFY